MAAFHLSNSRSHTLRHPALEIGMDCVVLQAQNVPTGFRLPRGALDSTLLEEVGVRWKMCRPDELLLFLRKVSAEKLGSIRKHPGVPISNLAARKDVRGILVELGLNSLADVRRNCTNVDEASHAIIGSRCCDGGTAIRVADEKDRAADAIERALHHSDVLFE